MMKIIFLDIDGVLAIPDEKNLKHGLWELSNEKQSLLGKILDETNADIVLSSSWRHGNLENTKNYLDKNGFWFTHKLIGVTISAHRYIKNNDIHLHIPRGVEIDNWIDNNIHIVGGVWKQKKLFKDYNYVIIDDDSDMLFNQRKQFIKTNFDVGLTEYHVRKAIKLLNKKIN